MPDSRRAAAVVEPVSDRELLETVLDLGIRDLVTVPCSITDTWHGLAEEAAREGRVRLVTATHEANLAGIAAGRWFGTGQPALVHMQNSGLPNAGDGFISFAGPEVYRIPMTVLITWRGSHPDDDSAPHQAIGGRTEALCEAIFGAGRTFGDRDGQEPLAALRSAVSVARAGGLGTLRLSPRALRRTHDLRLPSPSERPPFCWDLLRRSKGRDSLPASLRHSAPVPRDEALAALAAEHPGAAVLYCNGFTSRAAQAVVDRRGNFYNVGYMGGTMAVGWGLATVRPDLEVVVVDGDQNAQMSAMKDRLLACYPPNLHWYILDNGIGASVGTAESLPLSPLYDHLARVVPTLPDAPGTFRHPRVASLGAYAGHTDPDPPDALAGLASGFRRWVEQQGGETTHDLARP